jgi:hypothetical protein
MRSDLAGSIDGPGRTESVSGSSDFLLSHGARARFDDLLGCWLESAEGES